MTINYKYSGRLIELSLFLFFLCGLYFKSVHVNDFVGYYTGEDSFALFRVVLSDLQLFLSCISVYFIFGFVSRSMQWLSKLGLWFCLVVYLVDCYVVVNFNSHLTLADAQKYWASSYEYVVNQNKFSALCVLLSFILLFLWLLVHSKIGAVKRVFILLISLAGFFFLSRDDSSSYIHTWITKNVVSYHFSVRGESEPYSQSFIYDQAYSEYLTCSVRDKELNYKNIIVVMIESLSSYQSKLFSGIRDWTPRLDAIGRNNVSFENFYANGFTTEDAQISILLGEFPIYSPSSNTNGGGTSFKGFFDWEQSLPKRLKSLGYKSNYITSADLTFSNTGVWATSIGFDYVEGHDHEYYSDKPRYHFKASPDKYLYKRVLSIIKSSYYGTKSNFYFVKTVSSHHPFYNPDSKIKSEEEAFRYADQQFGDFYESLKSTGFFDDGLLLVVGDHHSMVPLKLEEINNYGIERASAKVPMILVSHSNDNIMVTNNFQQVDIFQSLISFSGGRVCNNEWYGNFHDVENLLPPAYVLHRRGDQRSQISAFSKNKSDDSIVYLMGDRTHISNPGFDSILNKINYDRVKKVQ